MNRHRIEVGSVIEAPDGEVGTVVVRENLRLEGRWVRVIMENGETRNYRPRQLTVLDGALKYPAE